MTPKHLLLLVALVGGFASAARGQSPSSPSPGLVPATTPLPRVPLGPPPVPETTPLPGPVPGGASNPFDSGPPAASPAAAPVPSAGPTVVDVVVQGNKKASLSKVYSYIRTRKGREFDAQQVQADVRRLNQSGLFRDVRTFTEKGPDGVVVRFELLERATIGYLRFVGNRGIRDKTLLKQAELKVGESLNQYSVEEGRRKVQDYYRGKGFPKAEVSILEGDKPTDEGVVFVCNEGNLERISSVEFVGNTIASDDRLKTQIDSKPGFLWYFFRGQVDREKIDADIEKLTAYYRSLGFFRARIGRELEFDDSGRWMTLRFVIDEGPRYVIRSVSVVGNQKFSTDSLMAQLDLKSGEHFNQAKMNRDLVSLRDAYGAQGHVYADVQADPRFLEEPGELDLIYKIKEGDVFRVGNIGVNIAGEFPHTRQSVVMNRISLRPGDILDVRELRKSEQRLKGSQLFEIDPSKGAPPEIAVVPPDGVTESGVANRPRPRTGSRAARGQSPD